MTCARTQAPQEQMPPSEAPNDVIEPSGEPETSAAPTQDASKGSGALAGGPEFEPGPRAVRGSRWVDYDTHELLEMIGELEDERRWARLREGFWIALQQYVTESSRTRRVKEGGEESREKKAKKKSG